MVKDEEKFLFKTKEIAEIFGVTSQSVTKWKVNPKKVNGRCKFYDIREITKYKISEEEEKELSLTHERAKLAKSQTKKNDIDIKIRMLDLKERKGQLIAIDKVKNGWADVIISFRSKILSIPTRIAKQVLEFKKAQQVESFLKKILNEALEELSKLSLKEISKK